MFKKLIGFVVPALLPLLYFGCVDPVAPEYIFIGDQIIIEGLASSVPGTSYVTINQTSSDFGIYRNLFQKGATVTFTNVDTGQILLLEEREDVYVPSEDFVVATGETWELDVVLADGRNYKSRPETVVEPVEVSKIRVEYNKEVIFREDSGKFVPGHSILVDFEDPPNKKNYYFWRFRSFERQTYCEVCYGGNFRDGECKPNNSGASGYYFVYYCEQNCWRIRFNESIEIYDDKFSDGTSIRNLPVGNVLLYNKENILVQLEQVSVSYDAYEYYKRLKDIVDNNGNFDAPPPSAVVGNIFNPGNTDEIILGRFTAASSSQASIFIERNQILEDMIESILDPISETDPPYRPNITTAPCDESRTRTSIRPEGWIGN